MLKREGPPNMSANSKKQLRKRKARQRRVCMKKTKQQKASYVRRHYPEIEFQTNEADPDFVNLIKQATSSVSFDDPLVFSRVERNFYKSLKKHGGQAAIAALAGESPFTQGQENACQAFQVLMSLGNFIFKYIPKAELLRFIPYHDVQFVFVGNTVVARFSSLLQARGPFGSAFHSKLKPTLDVNGVSRTVAFSRHAIERICERIHPNWETYTGLGDVYAFFGRCVYFERCDLYGGQLGFTFFERCDNPLFWQYKYVLKVMGQENVRQAGGTCYYRVGYCPAVIDGDFIKAKTLLFPGYSGTPEYGLIRRSPLSESQKREMTEKASRLEAKYMVEHGDFDTIKWFHDNGVPQVVQLKQTVFQLD
jgi:hypothetical protein